MKYPQLVSDRAVSTISDWLITRLELLGVEAPIVYSRLLLSLLHTPLQVNSLDVAEIPQLKNWLGKRFNSRRLTQSDAERLKRVAAIESLMEVVEANEKRSRIVDLVSELCGKLRELERSEEEDVVEVAAEKEVQEEHKVVAEENNAVAGSGGARNKELIGDRGKRSNPYYQMFPALSSGNVPPPASLSGVSTGPALAMNSNNVELNGGRGDNLQRSKWRMEPATAGGGGAAGETLMTNGSPTTMAQEGERGGGGGDKGSGSTKRKNKKRRTNGPSSGDKKSFATSSPSNLKIKLSGQYSNGSSTASGCRKTNKSTTNAAEEVHFQQQYPQQHRQPRSKYVEWDTNFSGQWEMEEQDPIKEFLNAQRTTKTAAAAATASDCESMASVQLRRDDGYDNVFKMKRSDVNEEQTMLIKSFLKQKTMNCDTTTNTASTDMMQMPMRRGGEEADKEEVAAFGFNLVETEEYFNLISPIEGGAPQNGTSPAGGRGGRLFEREVSSELSSLSHGMSVGVEDERLASEFDAKLDAFKAKFDTNIRNLWSQEGADGEAGDKAVGEEQELQQQQPMSVNSFWQNYNKHLYEFQDGGVGDQVTNSLLDINNNSQGTGGELMMNGGWLMGGGVGSGVLGPQENSFNLGTFQQQQQQPSHGQPTTIWSNNDLNEYEEQQQAEVESRRHCMQQYNEHMAAAYQKQMQLGFGMCAPTNMEQLDLFTAAKWAAADGCSSSISVGGGSLDASMNDRELEQLYYSSSFRGCDYDLSASEANIGQTVDSQLHQNVRDGMIAAAATEAAADIKLEQSIAMINHSSTGCFAKVDRQWMAAGAGPRSRDSSSITNLSSLYGSFKNSTENLLTSERTHFRPIKQAYLDGHTFDIPSSPDTIEYVRSASGSIFFELDKYMEYTVTDHGRDAYDEQQRSTNVPISRCGTIEEKERCIPAEREEDASASVADASKNNFTLKFCVRTQNEKCCQTEVIDYEQMQRIETSNSYLVMGRAATMRKYPKHLLPNVCTLSCGREEDLEAAAYELLEDKWKVGGSYKNHNDISMLWENSGDSNSLDSFSLNCYESLPANRLLRDELSADAEEILNSLTYMQNLYIDDMEEDGPEEEQEEWKDGMALDEETAVLAKNAENLANYYEMGQLISEILNPGTVKQIAQAAAATAAAQVGENDVLWYKNWSLGRSWLPDGNAIATTAGGDEVQFCKARNVWHYGNGNGNGEQVNGVGVFNQINNHNNNINCNSAATVTSDNNNNCVAEVGGYDTVGEVSEGDREAAGGDWKFSNLRMLWNDTQNVLNGVGDQNEEEDDGQRHIKKERKSLVIEEVQGRGDEEEEEEEEELGLGEDLLLQAEEEEKNYHLIIFEKRKKDPSAIMGSATAIKGGRKRRHSASQNLFDDDLELFNGDDVKWYDYCCKCDCGKRSEKILRYRNKLLMKRVDKLGYVHNNNASLFLKNFSKQFDSIDEILNEGLICNAAAAAIGEICDYEGEYCGGAGVASGFTAEKLNNLEQVSLMKNPNMYLNRTALISLARPLTR